MTQPAHGSKPPSPTRARIEAACVELFFERGFEGTSMREIALACGFTVGALYNHVASKDDLLVAIMDRVHAELDELLHAAVAGAGGDPAAELRELVRAHALFHTRHRHDARVANAELSSLPPADRRRIVAWRRRMRSMFSQAIERGTFDVPDVTITTMAILNMGIHIADWYVPDGAMTGEQVADAHAALAMRMVGGTP